MMVFPGIREEITFFRRLTASDLQDRSPVLAFFSLDQVLLKQFFEEIQSFFLSHGLKNKGLTPPAKFSKTRPIDSADLYNGYGYYEFTPARRNLEDTDGIFEE